jgi:mycothiol synthase
MTHPPLRPAQPFAASNAADDDLAAVHELLKACHQEVMPLVPYRGLVETVGYLRFPPADEDRPAWVVEDGSPCGFAVVRHVRGAASAWLELRVHPAYRRRGAGTALLEAARSYAAETGVGTLLGHCTGDAGAGFRRRAGAREGQRDIRSALRLSQEPPAAAPVPGYRLVRWTGACPERLLASYARARAAVNDAPHADADDEAWSPRRVRDLEAAVARRNRETRVTAVVAEREAVVAFTETRVSPAPSPTASIEDTAVLRQHRRKGLATWMKADALAALRSERPDVAFVLTSNAYENHPIRAVNERLGFEPAVVWTTAVLPV